MLRRSLSALKPYRPSGSTGKSTDFKALTLPRAVCSALPWRGGNTWHCSGVIPAASYSQQRRWLGEGWGG